MMHLRDVWLRVSDVFLKLGEVLAMSWKASSERAPLTAKVSFGVNAYGFTRGSGGRLKKLGEAFAVQIRVAYS